MKIIVKPPFIFVFFIILSYSKIMGQGFGPPLDIPLKLAGSFGELRPNHLHSGTDFRTLGITGLNVYAIADGYVSRIKIEPEGYGRVVYITHPNGYISLYAHLEKLRGDIENYCKKEQYKQSTSNIDIILKPHEINVKKEDFIAWSGNSGGTSGPHLHLEVREEKSQDPLNALRFYHDKVSDTIPPVIEKIWIYPLSEKSAVNRQLATAYYNVATLKGQCKLMNELPILIKGDVGIGVQAYDRTDSTNIRSGVYAIDLYLNNKLIFQQVMDKYSFAEGRYVNSLIDYEYYIRNQKRINRLYLQPNNHFSIYKHVVNSGVVNAVDTFWQNIDIRVKDAFRNETNLSFKLKGDLHMPKFDSVAYEETKGIRQKMFYQKDNLFIQGNVRVFVPKNALYDDFIFTYSTLPQQHGYYSDVYQIHNRYVPLHKSVSLRLKPTSVPERLASKILLLNLNEQGQVLWSGGAYKDGYISANIRAFGKFVVGVDTIPPSIEMVSNNLANNDFTHWQRIAFFIRDGLSGIKSFNGLVDGHWALFEYDPKLDLLFYEFDPVRLKFGQKHKLDLFVTDEKNNIAEFHGEFFK